MWEHPKSRKWHCIDHIILQQAHRRNCLDVSVMRGADCNTDHMMLRANVVVGRRRYFKRCRGGVGIGRLCQLLLMVDWLIILEKGEFERFYGETCGAWR